MRRYCNLFLILLLCIYPLTGFAHSVRPGTSPEPQSQSIQLQMNASFVFPSSYGSCAAGIENPAGSGTKLRYTLYVSQGEIARVSGIILDDLNLENDLILFQSNLIMPGEHIDHFSLRRLPNHRALLEGTYQAQMNVTPYPMSDGTSMNSEFQLKVDVIIMASMERAKTDQNGLLDFQAFNNSTSAAHFMLVLKEESLPAAGETMTASVQDKHSYLSIAEIAALKPGELGQLQLHALPDGGSLKMGEYTAWLLRVPIDQSEEVYAVSRVTLKLPFHIEAFKSADSVFSQPDSRAIAQAVVNCEYLLGLGGIE